MCNDLFVCRSLTHAQRRSDLLAKNGIHTQVVRTPRLWSPSGCSYSVSISSHKRDSALTVLTHYGLAPLRILTKETGGAWSEVTL